MQVSGFLLKLVYLACYGIGLDMTSTEAQELKYSYKFAFAARSREENSDQASKLELQEYINDVLGISSEKKPEARKKLA